MRSLAIGGLLAALASPAPAQGFVPGNLFVADASGAVLELTPNGNVVRSFTSAPDFGAGPARGLAFDAGGALLVGAPLTAKVVAFDGTGTKVGEIGGAGLADPHGIAVGPNGERWVASAGSGEVLVFDAAGSFVRAASGGGLGDPRGLAFGPGGHLFVGDENDHAAYEFDPSGSAIVPRGTGAGSSPYGVAFGPDGRLYVTTTAPPSVVVLDATGIATTITDAALTAPRGLAFTFHDRLVVANEVPPAVLVFHFTPGNTIVQPATDPAMAGPLFVAVAPARFGVKASGKRYTGTATVKVSDAHDAETGFGPVLSLSPAGALLALGDDPTDPGDLASLLGAPAVALMGTTMTSGDVRAFAGTQVPAFGDRIGSATLFSNGALDSVKGSCSFQLGDSVLVGKLKGKRLP